MITQPRPARKPLRIGYARVSTDLQTTEQWIAALWKAGCDEVYVEEAISAAVLDRPELKKVRERLQTGDTLVVGAYDRAFRTVVEAILFLDSLIDCDIRFESLIEIIDPRTPEGRRRYIYQHADAEYERAMISLRTRQKMAVAKAAGKHLGRPYKLSKRKVVRLHQLVTRKGVNIRQVAEQNNVAPITVRRAFKRLGLE